MSQMNERLDEQDRSTEQLLAGLIPALAGSTEQVLFESLRRANQSLSRARLMSKVSGFVAGGLLGALGLALYPGDMAPTRHAPFVSQYSTLPPPQIPLPVQALVPAPVSLGYLELRQRVLEKGVDELADTPAAPGANQATPIRAFEGSLRNG